MEVCSIVCRASQSLVAKFGLDLFVHANSNSLPLDMLMSHVSECNMFWPLPFQFNVGIT